MPRSRGGAPARSVPSRPAAPAPTPRPVAPQQQQRPMSTAPTQQAHPPAQVSQGPGLFGQMASTAAGVAVGSSIGHAIGGLFSGGSSSVPVEQQQQPNALYNNQSSSAAEASGPCATDIKNFTDCMNQNQGNMTICGWYMEQLKACQQAARQY
ncbi:uncharacterized protein Z518_05990 [Rhinocladiella mackenziei CBS 650.93]|uniref:CHCH domain-containing protein n=1 Tax=Rhinocladiella mackenziei CBS 650.93 TaxID=1442369 RepID=A0A0D2H3Z3_9EURO|nr:uncharacterized protein Z518_05990 [Rhinocladiella mackenziei CBS 650.93]KIX05118.1 hypothetical protein Z518_05990 [Rhinocladiella mackenziei CBS 650.93]